MAATADPVRVTVPLARARFATRLDTSAIPTDRARRGSIAARRPGGRCVRAEPGPRGALLLEVSVGAGTDVTVWGPAATPAPVAAEALESAIAWAGLRDRDTDLREVVGGHPVLGAALRHVGRVRLSRLPAVGEALGRAVLTQLVQAVEGHRSIAQVAARAGAPAPGGLWTWPSPERLRTTPSWDLRRCGVSLRQARALQAGAADDTRLRRCDRDWPRLDARLRALPGVGAWSSAEVRLALGDPDAVSVGDDNLPELVGFVLAGVPDGDDTLLLELLAPFEGQRGRVLQLILRAIARRALRGPPRTAPRAALAVHRYW